MNKVVAPSVKCSHSEYPPCYTCSNLNKIAFLMETKSQSSDDQVDDTSPQPFDRLPDELLVRIFNYITPTNMDNFITFIATGMVSKQFRRCTADNKKILEEMTELVIGFHPDLPFEKYLCHIGYFTLKLFLQRVKKISKVIINMTDDWMCSEMMKKVTFSSFIDRFGEKIELQQLILHKYRYAEDGSLVKKLIDNAQPFLQTAQISIRANDFSPNITNLGPVLAECSHLQKVKFSLERCESFDADIELDHIHLIRHLIDFPEFLSQLKSVNVLEINGYIPIFIQSVVQAVSMNEPPLHLQIKVPKIAQLLENARQKNFDDMKISITFKHSDIDREGKLAIVYNLLNSFAVPHVPQQEDKWEFVRGKLCVNLKLEKFEDESMICHPHPPPENE